MKKLLLTLFFTAFIFETNASEQLNNAIYQAMAKVDGLTIAEQDAIFKLDANVQGLFYIADIICSSQNAANCNNCLNFNNHVKANLTTNSVANTTSQLIDLFSNDMYAWEYSSNLTPTQLTYVNYANSNLMN